MKPYNRKWGENVQSFWPFSLRILVTDDFNTFLAYYRQSINKFVEVHMKNN